MECSEILGAIEPICTVRFDGVRNGQTGGAAL
jgi:hypothetical protein